MEENKLLKLTEETIERTIKDDLTTANLDIVFKYRFFLLYVIHCVRKNNFLKGVTH